MVNMYDKVFENWQNGLLGSMEDAKPRPIPLQIFVYAVPGNYVE